ncbi:hypothetical protein V7793_02410 [Streptomyces sp. KLMMK]
MIDHRPAETGMLMRSAAALFDAPAMSLLRTRILPADRTAEAFA